MSLYAFIVEDGNGKGQLVGLFLLAGEGNAQMKTMVEVFHNVNPKIIDTKTIILTKTSQKLQQLNPLFLTLTFSCAPFTV